MRWIIAVTVAGFVGLLTGCSSIPSLSSVADKDLAAVVQATHAATVRNSNGYYFISSPADDKSSRASGSIKISIKNLFGSINASVLQVPASKYFRAWCEAHGGRSVSVVPSPEPIIAESELDGLSRNEVGLITLHKIANYDPAAKFADYTFCRVGDDSVIAAYYSLVTSSKALVEFYDASHMRTYTQHVRENYNKYAEEAKMRGERLDVIAARKAEAEKEKLKQFQANLRPGQIVKYLDREARVLKLMPPSQAFIEVGGAYVEDLLGNRATLKQQVSVDILYPRNRY